MSAPDHRVCHIHAACLSASHTMCYILANQIDMTHIFILWNLSIHPFISMSHSCKIQKELTFFSLEKLFNIHNIVSLHQWLLKLTSLCIILIGVSIRLLSLPYSGLTLFIHPDINNNTTQYRCWYLMLLLLWVEYTVLLLLLGIEQSFTISTIYGFFTPFILQLPSLNIFRLFSQWINYPSDFQKVDFTM